MQFMYDEFIEGFYLQEEEELDVPAEDPEDEDADEAAAADETEEV